MSRLSGDRLGSSLRPAIEERGWHSEEFDHVRSSRLTEAPNAISADPFKVSEPTAGYHRTVIDCRHWCVDPPPGYSDRRAACRCLVVYDGDRGEWIVSRRCHSEHRRGRREPAEGDVLNRGANPEPFGDLPGGQSLTAQERDRPHSLLRSAVRDPTRRRAAVDQALLAFLPVVPARHCEIVRKLTPAASSTRVSVQRGEDGEE